MSILATAITVSAANSEAPAVEFARGNGKVTVAIDGLPVAVYCYDDVTIPRPYFAHVRAPLGVQVTRHHPPIEGQDIVDHPTLHPGIWMSFGDISGSDYWRNTARVRHVKFVEESRGQSNKSAPPLWELLRGDSRRPTLLGILLASVPLIGAWAGSKWMIPWADHVSGATAPGYKSTTQLSWATGAVIGSFLGAPIAAWIGRRLSYFLISVGATVLTWAMFQWTAPLEPSFLPIVFSQGLVATLFFGWLPLYLPELFPVQIRASGAGVAMNIGRFATAFAVVYAGWLFTFFDNQYSAIGAACALIYALGMIVVFWAPNTAGKEL